MSLIFNTPIGRTLPNNRLDVVAHEFPNQPYASIPKSDDLSQGFRDISFHQIANAVNKASWWLDSQLGRSQEGLQTFAYTGPKDLRWPVLVLAAMKTGRKILLVAFHNTSVGAQAHLFNVTQCQTLFYADSSKKETDGLQGHRLGLHRIQAPNVEDWIDARDVEAYPFTKSWEEAKDFPVAVLHTSGTTGLPKPVIYPNSLFTTLDAFHLLDEGERKLSTHRFIGNRVFAPFPLMHTAGIGFSIIYPLFWDMIPVFGPPHAPLTAEMSDQVVQYGKVDGILWPPFLLEALVRNEASVKRLLNLKFVQWGSAPLSRPTASLLAAHVRLSVGYASTEASLLPYFELPPEDWGWIQFHPLAGVEFCHRTADLYELLLLRKPETEEYQCIFRTQPHLQYFYTKDLWSPHPSKEGLWRVRGRTDDMITLSDGRDVHVMEMELKITEHPLVRTALVGSQGRNGPREPFVLIEPTELIRDGDEGMKKAIEEIWPKVEEAIALNAGLGELQKRFVIFATENRPFKRVAKGSVNRKGTVDLYQREINLLYSHLVR